MTIHIPTALQSYSGQQRELSLEGTTVGEVLLSLDHRYPGIRFRIIDEQDQIRPHIRMFVNDVQAPHLHVPVAPDEHLYIICALSGG